MFRNHFQVFSSVVLCITLLVKYVVLQENVTTQVEPFPDILPKEKCQLGLCTCEDLGKLGGVCRGITEKNYINHISFSHTKYFPTGTFLGFQIDQLKLDNPEVIVEENVLEGIISLAEFYVKQSSIEIIPDFRNVKDFIKRVEIESSELTSLEGEHFQNLTLLFRASFKNNRIHLIDPNFFKGTDNIKQLILSNNKLNTIPPKLLDPMKKLEIFKADHNQLLHVNNLFSTIQPQYIYLNYNNITDCNFVLRLKNEKVKEMIEKMNNTEVVSHELTLCNPDESRVTNNVELSQIQIINLSYNSIQELFYTFWPCYKYGEVIYMVKVKILELNENKLQNLNTSMRNSQVILLTSAGNQIQYLTDEDFISIYNLYSLILNQNYIGRIDRNTFTPIRNNLNLLDLSYNSIKSINGSIRFLSHLRRLKLMHNFIQSFTDEDFVGLNMLSHLYLENNNIKDLGQLQQIPVLQILNIAFNNVKLITSDQLPKALKSLRFSGNPFECNCRLQPFLFQLNESVYPETDTDLCSQSAANNSLQNLLNCPDNCSCTCTDDGRDSFIFVDCSFNNLTVFPHFLSCNYTEELKMQDQKVTKPYYRNFIVMDQMTYPSLHIQDHVLGINLENNNLESLDATELPPNLLQLYLSNNMLKWLPESILEKQVNLKKISLSGNPWNCDCGTLKFKKWLTSNHDIIQDINETRCGNSDETNLYGKVVWTLTDLDLCPSGKGLIVFLSIGILIFMIFCLTVKVLYNEYNFSIKAFLFYHGFTFVREEETETDKVFDAFISFSNNDVEFVTKEITDEIEKRNPDIHLCLHYRHFRPGEFIYDNILLAVQNSKKTVLIISKNFLESDWCLQEFRAAHTQALQDKANRIIAIKVGDLPNDIDPSIKHYLDNTTYLTWGEKRFWMKLLYILPSHQSDTHPFPRSRKDPIVVLDYPLSNI